MSVYIYVKPWLIIHLLSATESGVRTDFSLAAQMQYIGLALHGQPLQKFNEMMPKNCISSHFQVPLRSQFHLAGNPNGELEVVCQALHPHLHSWSICRFLVQLNWEIIVMRDDLSGHVLVSERCNGCNSDASMHACVRVVTLNWIM